MQRDFLTVADVLGMHTVLMQRYGGAMGLRDPGALEADLYRPQTGYYEDILAEAAALMESLAVNHPFVDGNKRTAFVTAATFLRLNGWGIKPDPAKGLQAMEDLATNVLSEDQFCEWLMQIATPVP